MKRMLLILLASLSPLFAFNVALSKDRGIGDQTKTPVAKDKSEDSDEEKQSDDEEDSEKTEAQKDSEKDSDSEEKEEEKQKEEDSEPEEDSSKKEEVQSDEHTTAEETNPSGSIQSEAGSQHSEKGDEGDEYESGSSSGSSSGTSNTGGSTGTSGTSGSNVTNSHYTLLAWNNLGMHCMDDDYEVFSILPPYNTVNAQLIRDGKLVKDASIYKLTYEAIADPDSSINSTSVGKTNFWNLGHLMYGPGALEPDVGLEGKRMPGLPNQPQEFVWSGNPVLNWFEATGIPITPQDDMGNKNQYPLMRIKAWDHSGHQLASVDVVLPVSDEMDCRKCHASGSGAAARPASGWELDTNDKHDFRLNILKLHDQLQLNNPTFRNALQSVGYSSQGLYFTAKNGTPILCAKCHSSEALPGSGIVGIPPLTQAMHASHAEVISPDTQLALNAVSNRSACYQCHPGSSTQCLRGAMGSAVNPSNGQLAMQCQDCHGNMVAVGASTRVGWLDEPNCQSCHTGTAVKNSGQIRFTSVFDASGSPHQAADNRFATNANTPMAGHSLYRFSSGHGGLQCSACHGSTHAIWPSVHENDNILSNQIQGHSGVIAECSSCHTNVPSTVDGGPHGMHPIDGSWVSRHEDVSHRGCKDCHGSNSGGTVLSRAKSDRSFRAEGKNIAFWKGQTVGCYECHNGSGGEGRAPSAPSVSSQLDLVLNTSVDQASQQVGVSPTTGVTIRIVDQPSHGTAAVQGKNVVYFRDPGFSGEDSFTFAASNGKRESNLGHVRVQAQ